MMPNMRNIRENKKQLCQTGVLVQRTEALNFNQKEKTLEENAQEDISLSKVQKIKLNSFSQSSFPPKQS